MTSKYAAVLSILMYAQALLGFAALASVVLKDRTSVEMAANVAFVSERAPL